MFGSNQSYVDMSIEEIQNLLHLDNKINEVKNECEERNMKVK